jgi:hypothetical protein
MDDRSLWTLVDWSASAGGAVVECVMVSCCAGAELQLRGRAGRGGEPAVVLRELYPSKSDLYERAKMLQAEYEARGFTPEGPPADA